MFFFAFVHHLYIKNYICLRGHITGRCKCRLIIERDVIALSRNWPVPRVCVGGNGERATARLCPVARISYNCIPVSVYCANSSEI